MDGNTSCVEVRVPSYPQTHVSTVDQGTAITSTREVLPHSCNIPVTVVATVSSPIYTTVDSLCGKSNGQSSRKLEENSLLVEWEELLGPLPQTDSPSQEDDELINSQPLCFVDDDILNSPGSVGDEAEYFVDDQIINSPEGRSHTPPEDVCTQCFIEDDILSSPGSVINAPTEAECTKLFVDNEILNSPDDSSQTPPEDVCTQSFVDIDVLNTSAFVSQATGVNAVSNFEIEIHPGYDSLGEDEINERMQSNHVLLDSISHNSRDPITFQRTSGTSQPSNFATLSCRKNKPAVNTLQKGPWLKGTKRLVNIKHEKKRKFKGAMEKFSTGSYKQKESANSPMWDKRGAEVKVSKVWHDVGEPQTESIREVYNYSNCRSSPTVRRYPLYRDSRETVPAYHNDEPLMSAVSNGSCFQSSNSKELLPAEQLKFNGEQCGKPITLRSIHFPRECVPRRNSSNAQDLSRKIEFDEDVGPIGNDGIATWFHDKQGTSCDNNLMVASEASAVDQLQQVSFKRRAWSRYFEKPVADHLGVDKPSADYHHSCKPISSFSNYSEAVEMTPQRMSSIPSALPVRPYAPSHLGYDTAPGTNAVGDLETIHFQIENRSYSLKPSGNLTTLPFQLAKTEKVEGISLPPTKHTLSQSVVSQTDVQEFPNSQLQAVERSSISTSYEVSCSGADKSQSQVRKNYGAQEAKNFTSYHRKRLKENKKNEQKNAMLRRAAIIEASKQKAILPNGECGITQERQNEVKHFITSFQTAGVRTKSLSVISSPQTQSQSRHHLPQSVKQPIQFNSYDYHHVSCNVTSGSREALTPPSSTLASSMRLNGQSNVSRSLRKPTLPNDTASNLHSQITDYSPFETSSSRNTTLQPVPVPKQDQEFQNRNQKFLPNGYSSDQNRASNFSQTVPVESNTPQLLSDIDHGISTFVSASRQIIVSLQNLKQVMNSRTT